MLKLTKKGQSVVEYAVLTIVVLGAFLAVGNYVKRGIQGRWKAAVDDLGDQYDPRLSDSHIQHVLAANTVTRIYTFNDTGGLHTYRIDETNSIERRTGTVQVGE